jgi:GTP-binding protein
MRPAIAIVGRPNVGKSTLFNRLVGQRLALVDDRPGVTRDRREGDAYLGHLEFLAIDTAGLEEAAEGSLSARMRLQTEEAIEQADMSVFVVDARVGVTPEDQHFADIVRKSGKPVVLVANKAESKESFAQVYDAFRLGLGDPVPLSAEHGEGMIDLLQAILERLEELGIDPDDEAEERDENAPMRVAIIGRPNAGKSTLINRMVGEERLLTGPEAGITRDSIALEWEWRGKRVKLFDTAGLRRRAKVVDKLEKLAVTDGLRAVRFAEVVVLLLDATIPFEKQDLTIASLIEREGRAFVVGLNKWDQVDIIPGLFKEHRETLDRLLPQVKGAPLVTMSGLTGKGVDKLMEAVVAAHEVWNIRVPTARLNRWFTDVVDNHPPPAVSGQRIKLRYITQDKARPPHFVLFGTRTDHLPTSYVRYLVNSLRETFKLPGTPIRLTFRQSDNPYAKKK